MKVLVIDDEPTLKLAVAARLRQVGHEVLTAGGGSQGVEIVAREPVDVVLTDVHMPGLTGLDVLDRLQQHAPSTAVMLMTGSSDVRDAVRALQDGAVDYLAKPLDLDELCWRLERIDEKRQLHADLREARAQLNAASSRLVGQSAPFRQVIEQIDIFARSSAPVLIVGESGTGKELLAHRVHQMSARSNARFTPINCAALPESLVESELFGAERGAFTGANRRRRGRFQLADGGTIFLDEVAELPLTAQAKLLRVLQEGTVEPLGADRSVQIDVRIVSATHRDLEQRVADRLFREDLYYRLNVLNVRVPPLRRRLADLLLLVEHFIQKKTGGGGAVGLTPAAWTALRSHDFPGNVRELEHAIEYAVVVSKGAPIDIQHLPESITGQRRTALPISVVPVEPAEEPLEPLRAAAARWERAYLVRAVRAAGGRRGAAASLLGISRKSLWQKLKAYEVSADELQS